MVMKPGPLITHLCLHVRSKKLYVSPLFACNEFNIQQTSLLSHTQQQCRHGRGMCGPLSVASSTHHCIQESSSWTVPYLLLRDQNLGQSAEISQDHKQLLPVKGEIVH